LDPNLIDHNDHNEESNDFSKYNKGFEEENKSDDDINNHQDDDSVSLTSLKKKHIKAFEDKKATNNKKYEKSESNIDVSKSNQSIRSHRSKLSHNESKYSGPENKSDDSIKYVEVEIAKEEPKKVDVVQEVYNPKKMEEYMKKLENDKKLKGNNVY